MHEANPHGVWSGGRHARLAERGPAEVWGKLYRSARRYAEREGTYAVVMPPGKPGERSKQDGQDITFVINPWQSVGAPRHGTQPRVKRRCRRWPNGKAPSGPESRRATTSDWRCRNWLAGLAGATRTAMQSRRSGFRHRCEAPTSDQGPERDHATPDQDTKPRKSQFRIAPPEHHYHEANRAAPQAHHAQTS